MQSSRLVVILIIVSIFAIIASIFLFVRNKDQSPESIEDVTIEDDSVSVDKEVKPYVAPSTATSSTSSTSSTASTEEEAVTNTTSTSVESTTSTTSATATTEEQDEQESEEQSETLVVNKAPDTPTLTSTPSTTSKDEEKVEVNGMVGAEIYVNDWKVGEIASDGNKKITLNTAGGDGDKSFAIFLKNEFGQSGVLKVVIKKDTLSGTSYGSASTSTSSTSTSASRKGDWYHAYTNKEFFDVDDYRDYDIVQLELRDVCNENRNTVSYCAKTSSLDSDTDMDDLGEDKCPSSCNVGQSCLLWNNKRLSSGSLRSWVALYRCE